MNRAHTAKWRAGFALHGVDGAPGDDDDAANGPEIGGDDGVRAGGVGCAPGDDDDAANDRWVARTRRSRR